MPGALLAKDIPPALAAPQGRGGRGAARRNGGSDEEPDVSLARRAYPLIDLLERAAKEGADVLWDKG